jgi:hypothetical protein
VSSASSLNPSTMVMRGRAGGNVSYWHEAAVAPRRLWEVKQTPYAQSELSHS